MIDEQTEKVKNAVKFYMLATGEMEDSFKLIGHGMALAADSRNSPAKSQSDYEAGRLLCGAFIVHLFALWDEFFDHSDVQLYFTPEEQRVFYAYKHLRIVFAHNIDGKRKSNRVGRDRMAHAEKFDEIMVSNSPLQGVRALKNYVGLYFPDAILGCQSFLAEMAKKLATGRIESGGAFGEFRASGDGETDSV